jgi:glycolate oxidase iron-sulfur subunit
MQTDLAAFIKDTAEGREADAILRACVHCGFCTATCPTYQLLGDELDGPRGRIYLIKQVLEGETPTEHHRLHLDRCLTCRACETTCPSGVRYGRLADIGRKIIEERVPRAPAERAIRWTLSNGLRARSLFSTALSLGRAARPFLPQVLAGKVPHRQRHAAWPQRVHARRMLIVLGCVQPSIAPDIDAATARILDRVGIQALPVEGAGCCGALPFHLNDQHEGLELARRNIDVWWPHIEQGAEAILVTASGCGVMVKEYGDLLRHDSRYAEKAARVSQLAKDPVEVVGDEWRAIAPQIAMDLGPKRVAFQSPCSLQHGMKLKGRVEEILRALGHELVPIADPHLCCGSAGTYAILQPAIAADLKRNKLAALHAARPEVIATANIGCLTHLAGEASRPVLHWIELLDERMLRAARA